MATSTQQEEHNNSEVNAPEEEQICGTQDQSHRNVLDEEGHLLKVFKMVAKQCVEKCFNAKNSKQFAKSYRSVWKNNKEEYEDFVQKVLQKTKLKLVQELEMFMESENMPDQLSKVDMLLNESRITSSEKIAWRPSGNPDEDVNAHVLSMQLEMLDNYKQQFEVTQTEEKKLKEQLLEKRKELNEIRSQVSSLLEKGREMGDLFTEFNLHNEGEILSCLQRIDCELVERSSGKNEAELEL